MGPSWQPDPSGRHQYRWWDGNGWATAVADDGRAFVDTADRVPGHAPRRSDSPSHGSAPRLTAPEPRRVVATFDQSGAVFAEQVPPKTRKRRYGRWSIWQWIGLVMMLLTAAGTLAVLWANKT